MNGTTLGRKAAYAAISLCLTASQASAQLCSLLTEVDRLEREVRVQLQNTSGATASPDLEGVINRVVLHAGKLSGFVTYVADFDRALDAYTFSIMNIYAHQSRVGSLTTASRLSARAHGGICERMLSKSDAFCPELDENRPPPDPNTDDRDRTFDDVSGIHRLDFTAPQMLIAAAALVLGSLGFWGGLRRARKKAAQNVRFQCNFNAQVFGNAGQKALQIADVSATGAKLRLLPDTPLDPTIKIQIRRRKFPALIAWQNAHYAGIVFHKPLPRRCVEMVSDGKVLRSRAT